MHAHASFPSRPRFRLLTLLLLCCLMGTATAVRAQEGVWRLQVLDAAVVTADVVRLGDIARPLGEMDPGLWQRLAGTELFAAPERPLRPMSVTRAKLMEILQQQVGEAAKHCILPGSLALQRDGGLVRASELTAEIVRTLTPLAATLGGEAEFRDFRTPEFLFLRDPTHRVGVELATADLKPGRVSLRLRELAMDGSAQRSATASVFMDLWKTVPVAGRPLNRGEALDDSNVAYQRKNMANLRNDLWDGKSGFWRLKTALGKDEVIYQSSVESLPLVGKGDVVRLVYRGTNIRLEVPAEAMSDGGYNESIPVRNMQTQVQVYARVLDAKTVQVF